MVVTLWVGIIATIVSIVAFGFLSVPMKVKCVRKIDPMFIQMFMSVPVLFGGIIMFPFTYNQLFSWYGLFGACLWVPASSLSIFAVRLVGISVAQSCWSGVTIVVAYVSGILICHEKFSNVYCQIIGVIFLICAIGCISLSKVVSLKFLRPKLDKPDESTPVLENASLNDAQSESSYTNPVYTTLSTPPVAKKTSGTFTSYKTLFGVLLAVFMGMFNGMSMVPAKFESNTFAYVFTFGVAQFFIGNVFVLFYFQIKAIMCIEFTIKSANVLRSSASGLICGIIWVIGYAGQLGSVISPMGLSMGFVLIQTTIIISSIVGILFFKEIRGWLKLFVFSMGVLLIFPGVILLYFF